MSSHPKFDYDPVPNQYSTSTFGTSQYGLGDYTPPFTSPFISHQVEIVSSSTVYYPESRNVWNEFDEHGLISGLSRLKAENNSLYKRRIQDVFVNRANSSYRGLINGITRELGLELFQPITINPKRSLSDGRFFAPDPYIKFDGSYLYLYSDYSNRVLEHQIDRFEQGGNYEHLASLVEFVNQTTYFEATLEDESYAYTSSMSILSQSNRTLVAIEDTQESNRFKLNNPYVSKSTLIADDPSVFGIEVDSVDSIKRLGQYHIDYTKGLITLFGIPEVGTVMRYEYTPFPFKPVASPILLHDINSENFKIKLFEQVLNDDGSYSHGLPSELGTDIINELYSITPMYWGI